MNNFFFPSFFSFFFSQYITKKKFSYIEKNSPKKGGKNAQIKKVQTTKKFLFYIKTNTKHRETNRKRVSERVRERVQRTNKFIYT